jgi:hypothetical protein
MIRDESSGLGDDFPTHLVQPVRRALAAAGVQNFAQPANFREARLRRLHGIDPKAMLKLSQTLADRELAYAPE